MDSLDKIYNSLVLFLDEFKQATDYLAKDVEYAAVSKMVAKLSSRKLSSSNISNYIVCVEFMGEMQKIVDYLQEIKLDRDKHSDSFVIGFNDIATRIRVKFSRIMQDIAILEATAVDALVDEIYLSIVNADTNASANANASAARIAEIDKLRAAFHKNPVIAKIYANVAQKMITGMFKVDPQISYKVLNYISEDKDAVLEGNAINHFPKVVKDNPPASRFGLIPNSRSDAKAEPLDTFIKKNANAEIGFVVITSVLFPAIEFDIKPLIVREEAAKYKHLPTAGITALMAQRFETIRRLDNKKKWKFDIKVYNEKATKFYVLETLDGTTYRFLAPWISADMSKMLVSRFRIEKLLNHNPNKADRAANYHAAVEKKALSNMFLGKTLDLADFNTKLTEIESGKLQANIITDLMNVIEELAKKEYGNKFKNQREVAELLKNDLIVDSFIRIATHYIESDVDKFDGGKFPFYEIMASFLVQLQTSARRLVREIQNNYSMHKMEFSGDTAKDYEMVMEKVRAIITKCIDVIIKTDDNLYTSNYFKYLILNYV
jgi:hypothetical protein